MLIFNENSIKEILRLLGEPCSSLIWTFLYISIITKNIFLKAKTNIDENYFSFLTKLVFVELIVMPICYLFLRCILYDGNFNDYLFISSISAFFGLIICGIIEYILCIKNNIFVKIEQKNNYHIFAILASVIYVFTYLFSFILLRQIILQLFWTDASVAPPWFLDLIHILSPFMGGLATLVIIQFVEMESLLKKSTKSEEKTVLSCSKNSYDNKGLKLIIIHASIISLIFPLIIFYIYPILIVLLYFVTRPLAYLSSLF